MLVHSDAVHTHAVEHNHFIAASTEPIVTLWQVDKFSLFKVLLLGDVQIIGSLYLFYNWNKFFHIKSEQKRMVSL